MDRRSTTKVAAVVLSTGLAAALTIPAGPAAGAAPAPVDHRAPTWETTMSTLDTGPVPDASEVVGWYVDVTTDQVIVEATPEGTDAAAEWLEASGIDPTTVTVETTTDTPELFFDVVGGVRYYPPGARCTVGFSVYGGFITAGHCGSVGTPVRGHNGAAMGIVRGSLFPGQDMAYVGTNSNWFPRPWLANGVIVRGSDQAQAGDTVCVVSDAYGTRCVRMLATHQTVNYPQGRITGLIRVPICLQPGESGAPLIAGDQAQGIAVGGTGSCDPGVSYFQPVNPILSTFGLTLVTG